MDLSGIKKNIVFSILFVVLPALFSGAIYLLFRTSDTVIYQLFQNLFNSKNLYHVRDLLQQNSAAIPSWFIYSLPGGLWVFTFANFCLLFLNKETKVYFKKILFLLFGIVTSLEILQALHITDGRFDVIDILFYLVGVLIPLSISNRRIKKLKYQSVFKSDKKPFYALGFTICLFCATIYLADVLVAN